MNNEEKNVELDQYFITHYMNNVSMQHENIFDGLAKALYLIKLYLKSDDIVLYKNNNGSYELFDKTPYLKTDLSLINEVVNNQKNYQDSSTKIDFIPIKSNELDYLMCIVNKKEDNKINLIVDSLKIILTRMELYEKLNILSNIDGLTHLNNRMAFSDKISHYNKNNKHVIFIIFDLFRLKIINDEYGHSIGDLYIKGAAEILKAYFPSAVNDTFDYSLKKETGDNVYRIGGDEFVVLSENKSMEEINSILEKITREVKNLKLGIDENVAIGINYGVAENSKNESMEELYKIADKRLYDDKNRMYQELSIDRRRKNN